MSATTAGCKQGGDYTISCSVKQAMNDDRARPLLYYYTTPACLCVWLSVGALVWPNLVPVLSLFRFPVGLCSTTVIVQFYLTLVDALP